MGRISREPAGTTAREARSRPSPRAAYHPSAPGTGPDKPPTGPDKPRTRPDKPRTRPDKPRTGPDALLLAVALDAALAEPKVLHPVRLMGAFLRQALRHRSGAVRADRRRGAATVMIGLGAWTAAGVLLERAARRLPPPLRALAAGAVLKPTFAIRALLDAGTAVRDALECDDLDGARSLLAMHLVSRPTADLTAAEVAGAAIESLAENLTDSVVAPLSAAALGGAGAAYGYRFLNTADAVLGYRTPALIDFGRAAARADDVANLIPARVAAVLIAAAAPVAGGAARRAIAVAIRDHALTASPNAGWTMAAMAGALGVRLTKRGAYALNAAARESTAEDLDRALCIVSRATWLAVALAAGVGSARRTGCRPVRRCRDRHENARLRAGGSRRPTRGGARGHGPAASRKGDA